jgi:hypothetical protein
MFPNTKTNSSRQLTEFQDNGDRDMSTLLSWPIDPKPISGESRNKIGGEGGRGFRETVLCRDSEFH